MFIRQYKTKNKKTGKIYIKHQLVQSYRAESGPRQRVVMNLGKLNLDKSEWRRLAFALEGRLSGQESLIKEPDHFFLRSDISLCPIVSALFSPAKIKRS